MKNFVKSEDPKNTWELIRENDTHMDSEKHWISLQIKCVLRLINDEKMIVNMSIKMKLKF